MGKIILNGIEYGGSGGSGGIYAPVIYSDVERKIGVWRDNKPLYQKTVSIGSLPNNATKTTAHGISDIDTICSIDGIAYDGSGKSLPLGYINVDSYTYDVQVEVGKVNIEIKTKIDFSSYTGYITLRYTKTTDVAGSGDYNTYGVPTHHYSTNEQVIGTYFGKPLYEKTWDNLSIALNNDSWVYFNDPVDIDNVVSFVAYYNNSGRYLHCAISEYQRSDSNGIMFSGFSGFNRTVNRIVAQYTKTTDT